MKKFRPLMLGVAMALLPFIAQAQDEPTALKVALNEKTADIAPTMWGLFFEDINFAADGGLYAEMIKNYSFEFENPMMGWNRVEDHGAKGYVFNQNHEAAGVNHKYLRMQRLNEAGNFGLHNQGFRGIAVKEGLKYTLTFLAKVAKGHNLTVTAKLLDEDQVIGEGSVSDFSDQWAEYEIVMTAGQTLDGVNFQFLLEGEGELDVDMISMFPEDTWKGRKRGLRKDLVQLLADMNPGFLRFPGGCIVEGFDLENRYQWKKTIGEMEDREVMKNRWNIEFAHRTTPDYYQSFGIGFFEYFQLSEEIGAEPLPILSCGLACQFNTGEQVPIGALDQYVNDALDLIEFANGPVDSEWGSKRAEMGHPEPFDLKFIGVGNENWGPQYIERAKIFEKAIKAAYPEITIVSTSGPFPDGREFEYLWGELKKMDAELVDEHYYRPPSWFRENARRYDDYDRNGPKVFAGEYAAHSTTVSEDFKRNNWEAAMSEAAFMTGLERNADIVRLASYAPLFAHVDGWQWNPDLIWFDNLRSYGTTNYHVQKLFSTNPGTAVVPITAEGESLAGEDGLYASATIDETTNELIFKVVNIAPEAKKITIALDGKYKGNGKGTWLEMADRDLEAYNSLDNPTAVSPKTKSFEVKKKTIELTLQGQSVNVGKVKIK
ncbi:alpha-L-arabinofuranosidase C-terminal domain-containing protein [Echinicola vietnamensis]|uniref:non-reducing end alpha-L-arabinofuranosidase n=1 Tax=Echinicola vietnamensis (strain DSM 17526 / LMG 23754 / KMM 6221) TaxID=926556 RepID=L0FVK5_ECHVK|nr:alpha-L-arabinofuranosidase C-terminal domain-containing protein [Echinicola vietnamensis]AGA77929.1 alpha-L-arabinofuranosidase [Echinicola vietnamensis DSM 17526]